MMKKLFLISCFFMICYGNAQNSGVDFIRIVATVEPIPDRQQVVGKVLYSFLLNAKTDSIFIDAKNTEIFDFTLNGRKTAIVNDGERIAFRAPRKIGMHNIELSYTAWPKQALYFIGFDHQVTYHPKTPPAHKQVWTQGQGKYTSHWLPSFDDMNEKTEVDLTILFDTDFMVIANGQLVETVVKEGKKEWRFDMQQPMSNYLIAFAIGTYQKQTVWSKSGILIENYFYPSDSLKVEPTYRHTRTIFDFLETEIGVPYPWQNYKQVPVHDFLYAGMENTGTTLFSDTFVIDETAFIDRNYLNINAHELAHQWFGNLVTESSGSHHWLQEGFATFYAYLAEKFILGDDHFYWKLQETATLLKDKSEGGKGKSLLDPNADSLTFYEKGAWALILLREEVGETAFKLGIKKYLNTFRFRNATVDDFLSEMETASGKHLTAFKEEWLSGTEFPVEKAYQFLRTHSKSIVRYDAIKTLMSERSGRVSDSILHSVWTDSTSIPMKKQLISDFRKDVSDSLWIPLLKNETLLPRQRYAMTTDTISALQKPLFEAMLSDKSYLTVEAALYKLWLQFPKQQIDYLEATKHVTGLPNKNVRLLWLTLALVTPNYAMEQKPIYLKELNGYTSATFNPEVRQTAFQYLTELNILDDQALANLIKATNHYSWQFRNYARSVLDALLETETQKKAIERLSMQLNSSDLRYLKTKLQEP